MQRAMKAEPSPFSHCVSFPLIMQAARQAYVQSLACRPLTNLKDIVQPCLQRHSYATHGVGEGNTSMAVPRFYKTVHVTEAEVRTGEVPHRQRTLLLDRFAPS
jgi:hypothetical protein